MTLSTPAWRIREAISTINTDVKASLDRVRATREAVLANPDNYTRSAVTRAQRGWTRVVIEETVWAIAKSGLLCSPEQANVVRLAKEWAKSWPAPPDKSDAEEDVALYAAVQAMAASLEELDEVAAV